MTLPFDNETRMPTLSEYKMEQPENTEEIKDSTPESTADAPTQTEANEPEVIEDDLGVDVPDIPLPSAEDNQEPAL